MIAMPIPPALSSACVPGNPNDYGFAVRGIYDIVIDDRETVFRLSWIDAAGAIVEREWYCSRAARVREGLAASTAVSEAARRAFLIGLVIGCSVERG
jgi:hypothetical protein